MSLFRRAGPVPDPEAEPGPAAPVPNADGPVVEISDLDTFYRYLLQVGAPVDLTTVTIDSPAVTELKAARVELVVPLINQGELLGTLNLGRRLSDQPYSTDDRKLLESLASQVAPAIRVAQLVRQQEEDVKQRERIEQEMRVAALIQQTLLPKDLPELPGWTIDAHYQPARAVGGDFYDFLTLSDGRLGVVVGDVTDKGVPAALVMATTRSTLRAAAQRSDDPGEVLADTNRVLHGEIPPGMFVTCLYGILAPGSGDLRFANAGHNLPYVRTASGVIELRATGMPLGLLPGMSYEVKTANLRVGESMLLSSDGIAEAHNRAGAMFGLPRLMGLVAGHPGGGELIGTILHELAKFTAGGEQEDDVTMVIVRRTSSAEASAAAFAGDGPIELTSFSVPSEDGNERLAIAHVLEAVGDLGISPDRLQRLGTAVAEATMNAIEHGNHFNSDLPVDITVLADAASLRVLIKDHGGGTEIPQAETPDLDAKVAGLQTPRGWGLFLIKQMVDELHTETDDTHHTMELVIKREGAN